MRINLGKDVSGLKQQALETIDTEMNKKINKVIPFWKQLSENRAYDKINSKPSQSRSPDENSKLSQLESKFSSIDALSNFANSYVAAVEAASSSKEIYDLMVNFKSSINNI